MIIDAWHGHTDALVVGLVSSSVQEMGERRTRIQLRERTRIQLPGSEYVETHS